MQKRCEGCYFWKKDFGMWTMTGWTGMRDNRGHCHFNPQDIPKRGDDFCREWTAKYEQAQLA